MANGEFKDAIADGSLPFPNNTEVFFNYLNGSDGYAGKFMESTYTPNGEWIDIFFNSLDTVKNGSVTVDDYIAQMQPQMQEALDNAWESVQ